MREWNCDRIKGIMSIWFGNFPDEASYWKYFETFYCVHDETVFDAEYNMLEKEFNQTLERVFIKENEDRPFEQDFRTFFKDLEMFNYFEYDFGVTFDQDFQIGGFCQKKSTSWETVLGEWADDLTGPLRKRFGDTLSKGYNCFFAIPSCRYSGVVSSVKAQDYEVDFLGVIEEQNYSNEMAEKYNG